MVGIHQHTPRLFAVSLAVGSLAYDCLSSAHANALSLSLGQYQDTFYLSDTNIDLTPKGATIYGNLDITEQLRLNISYGRYEDDTAVNDRARVDLQSVAWSLGLSYQWQNWLATIIYGDLDEDINVTQKRIGSIFSEHYRAPSNCISINYGDFSNDSLHAWYWSLAAKLQYTDWQRESTRIRAREEANALTNEIDSSGDSLFTSLHFNLSKWQPIGGNENEKKTVQQSISYGAGISWHHLLSGETDILARNHSGTRASGGTAIRQARFSQQVNGEQYGLISAFMSYQFSPKLAIELDISTSFSAVKNASSGNITVSYSF